jgi:hypothetical protein
MKPLSIIIIAVLFACIGCAQGGADVPVTPGLDSRLGTTVESGDRADRAGRYVNWGVYQLEIARDGSYGHVIPDRTASAAYGYHVNAVKLLEVAPCTNCIKLSNIHVLANGDVSVDVTLVHPWPEYPIANRYCTGFDVRGIIMFPSSQLIPDNDLRARAGLEPWGDGSWFRRYASSDKGDAELMNPDGWSSAWAPDNYNSDFRVEKGLPIFTYYPGKFASGENLGTINAFKRYWTNEKRHMFENGKSATRTYVIRPPAQGPIKASYAVYAHWAPPTNVPVLDPVIDFPPEANSPLPYEFQVEQTGILDPDEPYPGAKNGSLIRWHLKTWSLDSSLWDMTEVDLLYTCSLDGGPWLPSPDGEPDTYYFEGFCTDGYKELGECEPDALPGEWPYIFTFWVFDPDDPQYPIPLGKDFYIIKVAIDEIDGDW